MKHSMLLGLLIGSIFLCREAPAAEEMTPSSDALYKYGIRVIEELHRQRPQDPAPYLTEGYFLHSAQQYEKALEAFLKAHDLQPDNPVACQMIAFLYAQIHDEERAVEWYRKTLQIDPKSDKANQRLGQALAKLNRHAEAVEAFRQEVRYYPKNAIAHYDLASSLFEIGQLEPAREHIQSATQANDLLPEPYYLLSKIHRKNGQIGEANASLAVFREKKKNESDYLGEEAQINDEVRTRGMVSRLLYELGLGALGRKDLAEAESRFLKAVEIDPLEEPSRLEVAKIHQSRGEIGYAITLLQQLVQINPKDARYHAYLGTLQGAQKQWVEAKKSLETALSLRPGDLLTQKGLARVLLNLPDSQAQAVSIINNIVQVEPTAENYDLLGRAYYQNGDPVSSLEALQQAMRLDPGNPVYQQRYAKIQAQGVKKP